MAAKPTCIQVYYVEDVQNGRVSILNKKEF
jgi:hypothetical protein